MRVLRSLFEYRKIRNTVFLCKSTRGWNRNIQLSNPTYVNEPLKIGSLEGNRFAVLLRLIGKPNDDKILTNCKNLNVSGFPNYFGLQRFGTSQTHTHEIGKLLLQRKWQEAFEAIISQDARDERANQAKK